MRPVALALRQLFEERGWSVTTIAAEIGFNRSTLQTRFTAQNPLSPSKPGDQHIIDAVLRAIDATPADLEEKVAAIEGRPDDREAPVRLQTLVRTKMRNHGVSLRDLASKLNVSYPRLSNRLTSPAGLDPSKPADKAFVTQIAEALGESPILWFVDVALAPPPPAPVTLSGILDTVTRNLVRSLGDRDASPEDRARVLAMLATQFEGDTSARGALMRDAIAVHSAAPAKIDLTPSVPLMLAILDLPEEFAAAFSSRRG